MLTKSKYLEAQNRAAEMIKASGIHILDEEVNAIEVVDFGLSNLDREGVQVFTFVNTNRVSAKILVLFPNQTEPEHWHPIIGGDSGKEETIRLIAGKVFFYVPGENTLQQGRILKGKDEYYTMRHEIVMNPGASLTLEPGTKHWFQAGPEGAVMYSVSTLVRDEQDRFSDPDIDRITKVME